MRTFILILLALLLCPDLGIAAPHISHFGRHVRNTVMSGDDPFDYSSERTQRAQGGPYLSRFSRVFAVDSNLGELIPIGASSKANAAAPIFTPSWRDLGMEAASTRGGTSLMIYLSCIL